MLAYFAAEGVALAQILLHLARVLLRQRAELIEGRLTVPRPRRADYRYHAFIQGGTSGFDAGTHRGARIVGQGRSRETGTDLVGELAVIVGTFDPHQGMATAGFVDFGLGPGFRGYFGFMVGNCALGQNRWEQARGHR